MPAVQPVVKATRQDPGCVTTLRLSLMVIYVKECLFKCRCAKETDPNARSPIKLQDQVSCHFHWGVVTGGSCRSSRKVSHEWEKNRTEQTKTNAPSPKTITAATIIQQ